MAYATELEARLARKVTQAITTYNLVEDGDRVMVGLSGGKDSWALLQILDVLRRRAPIRFSLVAVTVDSGYDGYRHDLITRACAERGWECRIEHTGIGRTMDDLLDDGATPCSLCARLRRGVLYRLAREVGATKIALGHHADDFIETLLLNLFFAGSLKAMPARLVSDNGATSSSGRSSTCRRPRRAQYTQGAGPADDRLLLPGVRRSGAQAPARQAADGRARESSTRASRRR